MNPAKQVNPIHYVIVIAFCLFFRFVPGFAGITPLGMALIGSFIGAVYGWITIDMLWPSLIALLGVGLSSIGMNAMLAASFGNYIVVMLILCMGVMGMTMKTGAFDWVAKKLLSNKAMQGKPWFTIWFIIAVAWLLGFTNSILMMIIFGAFITSMARSCGVERNAKLVILLYLGVAFGIMLGQIMIPFLSTGLAFYGSYYQMFPNNPMPMGAYLLFMILFGVIMVTVWVLLMKLVFRVDASPLQKFSSDASVGPMTKDQKTSMILFLVFMGVAILAAIPIPIVQQYLAPIGIVGITLAMFIIIPFVKAEDGSRFVNIEECLHMGNWGQILMIAFIMVLATYMSTPETGITTAMAMLFMLFSGMSPWVFIVVAIFVSVILTNFANNMLIGVLVMPFLANFAIQAGIHPGMVVVVLFAMVQLAIATPAASPITAIAMSQEMADAPEMTKIAVKMLPLLLIIGMIIGLPLGAGIFAIMG